MLAIAGIEYPLVLHSQVTRDIALACAPHDMDAVARRCQFITKPAA
jgi:hypothetical protein